MARNACIGKSAPLSLKSHSESRRLAMDGCIQCVPSGFKTFTDGDSPGRDRRRFRKEEVYGGVMAGVLLTPEKSRREERVRTEKKKIGGEK